MPPARAGIRTSDRTPGTCVAFNREKPNMTVREGMSPPTALHCYSKQYNTLAVLSHSNHDTRSAETIDEEYDREER
jgi:hypothetical protein